MHDEGNKGVREGRRARRQGDRGIMSRALIVVSSEAEAMMWSWKGLKSVSCGAKGSDVDKKSDSTPQRGLDHEVCSTHRRQAYTKARATHQDVALVAREDGELQGHGALALIGNHGERPAAALCVQRVGIEGASVGLLIVRAGPSDRGRIAGIKGRQAGQSTHRERDGEELGIALDVVLLPDRRREADARVRVRGLGRVHIHCEGRGM